MRNILFRGKIIDSDEWVEGSLVNNIFFYKKDDSPIFYIATIDNEECEDIDCWEDMTDGYGYYEVKPETVGQFTGLVDKNRKQIFEGDIVSSVYGPAIVEFVDNEFWCAFCLVSCENRESCCYLNECSTETGLLSCEVIGNIYDNLELLAN